MENSSPLDSRTRLLVVAAQASDRADWRTRLTALGYDIVEATVDNAITQAAQQSVQLALVDRVLATRERIALARRLTTIPRTCALVVLGDGEALPLSLGPIPTEIDFVVLPVDEGLLAHRIERLIAMTTLSWDVANATDNPALQESHALTGALRDIGQALSSTLDLDKLMGLILENVERIVAHDAATIIQIAGGFGQVTHMRGYGPEVAARVERLDFALDTPTLQAMMATDKAIVVPDVRNDPNWLPMDELFWIRSYCGIALRVHGEVVGFLSLDSGTPNAFGPTALERLQAFAAQAAIAIENARLYDALRRDSAELNILQRATSFLFSNHFFTQESLEAVGMHIVRTVVQEFGQIDCGIMLLDDTGTQLLRLARTGVYDVRLEGPIRLDGQGLVPAAVRSGQILYAPDVTEDARYMANVLETRSELVLPLKTSKGVIGALDLQSSQVDAFTTQNRRILQSFAEQAAGAIENVMLYDQLRRYSVDLEARVSERTAELNRLKDRAEAILNNSSDAIVLARNDGAIQQTNRAFDRIFRYEVDAAFGKPLSVLARLDYVDVVNDALAQAVRTNRPVRIEIMAATTEGAYFDADVVISPVQQLDGHVTSVVCSVRDITARRRTEQDLRHSLQRERELNDMKSRFISTASHEFRTPLAMIMTSSDLLLNYAERMDPAQRRQRLEKIQHEVYNITALLDDLLTISRASQRGQPEFNLTWVDMPALCLDILKDVQNGMGAQHRFDIKMNGEERRALIDSKLVKRILINLLSNAIKYSPPGSVISFELTCLEDEKIVRIQDEGIGIPEADQKNLFEAFHRGANVGDVSGTGLGLAIVKHAVDLHGGTIDVQSAVESGTTFILTFPTARLKEGVYEENSGD